MRVYSCKASHYCSHGQQSRRRLGAHFLAGTCRSGSPGGEVALSKWYSYRKLSFLPDGQLKWWRIPLRPTPDRAGESE